MPYKTQRRGDEFYTRYEDVENMLHQYLHILRAHRIICPCDTHASAFVRYLESEGISPEYSDSLVYKQFDYRDAIAVTNPPFSICNDYLAYIMHHGVRGSFTIIPRPTLSKTSALKMVRERGYMAYDAGAPSEFIRPDGASKTVGVYALHNFGYNEHDGEIRRVRRREDDRPIVTDEGILRYAHVSSVPYEWKGTIAVPGHWLPLRYNPDYYKLEPRELRLHLDDVALFSSLGVSCI